MSTHRRFCRLTATIPHRQKMFQRRTLTLTVDTLMISNNLHLTLTVAVKVVCQG